MASQQQAAQVEEKVFPVSVSWICRETKEVFISTRQAARHAGVTPSAMSKQLQYGLKFYRSKKNGHTYLVNE